jgi:polyphosphate kinase
MRRNLDDRVEAAVPFTDKALRKRLTRMLRFALEDHRLAWELNADGHYAQRQPTTDDEAVGLHDRLMHRAYQRIIDAEAPWDIV